MDWGFSGKDLPMSNEEKQRKRVCVVFFWAVTLLVMASCLMISHAYKNTALGVVATIFMAFLALMLGPIVTRYLANVIPRTLQVWSVLLLLLIVGGVLVFFIWAVSLSACANVIPPKCPKCTPCANIVPPKSPKCTPDPNAPQYWIIVVPYSANVTIGCDLANNVITGYCAIPATQVYGIPATLSSLKTWVWEHKTMFPQLDNAQFLHLKVFKPDAEGTKWEKIKDDKDEPVTLTPTTKTIPYHVQA